jgi:hypothetical protein
MRQDGEYLKYPVTIKKKVWAKASAISGHPHDIWRRDKHGNPIHWQEYGNENSRYGWKILNIHPDNNAPADINYLHPVHHTVTNI